MRGIILSVLAVVLTAMVPGCSSALRNVERDSSLDRVEAAKGEPAQDGSFYSREERLAEQEIRDRTVAVDPKRGYKILVVNLSNDPVKITIRKASFWFTNPIVTEFNFYGPGSKEGYLMPGKYDVSNSFGSSKVYEVTTAPRWDDQAKEYYCCVIRNRWLSNSELNSIYHPNWYNP
jgi:hypothetical protein